MRPFRRANRRRLFPYEVEIVLPADGRRGHGELLSPRRCGDATALTQAETVGSLSILSEVFCLVTSAEQP
jgi:hypothetical protein